MTEIQIQLVTRQEIEQNRYSTQIASHFTAQLNGLTYHWQGTRFPFVVDELWINCPDITNELRRAEERGRQDILSEFRKLTLDEIADMLNPGGYED